MATTLITFGASARSSTPLLNVYDVIQILPKAHITYYLHEYEYESSL